MKQLLIIVLALMVAVSDCCPAAADPSIEQTLRSLNFQPGTITLGDNLATLEQAQNFRFLDNADTQTFLTEVWSNPPGAGKNALGMMMPLDPNPLSEEGWAVIVFYDASGYVSDEEAGRIDYDQLMTEMQQATAESSRKRVAAGQSSIELLGWARKPYYDPVAKKLYWAKRLRFGDNGGETLNYQIRILGRRGVLELNIVASMSALDSIDQRVDEILSMVRFNSGNTYAEYNPQYDTVAAYGLGGLIAGGVLAKAGFFKGLIALLIASKKIVAVGLFAGVAAVWSAIKRRFRGTPSA